MTSPEQAIHDFKHSVRHAVHKNANLILIQGVITAVLGILAVIWPQVATLAADFYVGWIFLFAGVMGFVVVLYAPSTSVFLWTLLTAALSLFAGILLLWHPVAGAVSLTLVLISFFLAEGIFQIATSFAQRSAFPESWGWMLLSGVVDLVLAGLILAGWPGSATWALGVIVGVNLITTGAAITSVALSVRRVVDFTDKVLG